MCFKTKKKNRDLSKKSGCENSIPLCVGLFRVSEVLTSSSPPTSVLCRSFKKNRDLTSR